MSTIRILGITGGQYHDFKAVAGELELLFASHPRLEAEFTSDVAVLEGDLSGYDTIVTYTQGGQLTEQQEKNLVGFVRAGGGFVGLHGATASWRGNKDYIEMLGAEFAGHDAVQPFPVTITDPSNPVALRSSDFCLPDELYRLEMKAEVDIFASTNYMGKPQPMGYTRSFGKGRVAYLAGGHDVWWFREMIPRRLVLRAVDYTAGVTEESELTVGIVGYGGAFNMGRKHGTEMQAEGNHMKVVAVCDTNPERAAVGKDDFPGIGTYTDMAEMIEDAKPDIVVLITPHDSHAKLAIQALEAGCHVVVEKPMAIGADPAHAMVEAARKAGKVLTVYHNRRLDGDYLTLRRIVESGTLGKIFRIENCMGNYGRPRDWWRSFKDISGGVHYDWGAHNVDWSLGLLPGDKITGVAGYSQHRVWTHVSNQDEMKWVLRFDSGAVVDLVQTHVSSAPKPRWMVHGTKGSLVSKKGPNPEDNHFELRLQSNLFNSEVTMTVPYAEGQAGQYYINLADHLHRQDPLLVTAESARRVIAVVDTAEKSYEAGRELPMPFEDEGEA